MATSEHIQSAAQRIQQGGVIACPTEAVWGLSCDPWNQAAVQRILDLKTRPMHKGLILVAASTNQFDFVLKGLDAQQLEQLKHSWPGPNTWLVPHHNRLPQWITGEHSSVALRVSSHPLLQALCQLTGPLVSTSANPTGLEPALNKAEIDAYFPQQLDAVLDAPLGGHNRPSCIRDLLTGEIIRP